MRTRKRACGKRALFLILRLIKRIIANRIMVKCINLS